MRYVFYLSMLILSGCATIASGTTQSILVDTFNAPGATCKGTDHKGREYYWVNTPSASTVHKGDAPLNITCEKPGFKKTFHTIDETLTASTFGNIIAGGVIGVLVDSTSGAAQQYPSVVRFPLEPDESAPEKVKEEYLTAKQKMMENDRPKKESEDKVTSTED